MSFSLQRIERDPLWRREMRERWRRSATLYFLAFYALGLSYAAYSLYRSIVPPGSVQLGAQSHGIGHRLFLSLLNIQILSWIPMALLLGAPTIASERERHALTEYFLAGVSTRQIVRAKFTAVTTFIIVMCAIPLPVLALCFPLGGVDPVEFIAGFVLVIVTASACAATGILISTQNKRVPPAMQNAVFLALSFLLVAWSILPELLQFSVWFWLVMVAFLLWSTVNLVAGCENALGIVSRNLELEEHNYLAPPFSFSPPAPTVPTPLPESLQDGSLSSDSTQAEEHHTLEDDTAKVEGSIDGSSWDAWIEKMADSSAVAQREVRVGIRASNRRNEFSPPPHPYRYSLGAWLLLGMVGAVVAAFTGMHVWVYLGIAVMTLLASIAGTLGSSAAFTREREQKMIAQLQVCPLSALEVVGGKIGATLLLVARSWGVPLLALLLAGLSRGIVLAFETTLLVLLTLLFATTLATVFSLVCQRTAIAATWTLGLLFIVFLLLPLAPGALVYFLPVLKVPLTSFPLGPMWIEPLGRISWLSGGFTQSSLSPTAAMLRLICSLIVADALMVLAATQLWSRITPNENHDKRRFWARTTSRV